MTPVLRPARPLDAGTVGAILSGWTDETDWLPRVHSRAEDIAHAATLVERGWVTVAESQGRVLGFLARDAGRVHALYVAPQARGHRIGTRLIEAAQRDCGALELWTFVANRPARRFYERRGFAEITRTDGAANDEGLPDILYRWQKGAAR